MRKRMATVRIAAALAVFAALVALASRHQANLNVVDREADAAETQEILRLNDVQAASVPVQPLMAIEDTWDIEDTHEPADVPLVTRMRQGESELGYDAQTQTFYCTLGMDQEEWPQLDLQAAGEETLQVAWADDYAWDEVKSAIREGNVYRLLAWTDSAYSYVNIVFTGLPLVTMHVTDYDGLGDEYMPARFTMSSWDYPAVDLPAKTHLRSGGYSKRFDKWSYRVELQRRTNKGRFAANKVSLLGIEPDSDWLLISNASDDVVIRNHLGFELWNRWYPEGDGVCMLQSRLVEVFVQDQYMGLYQLLQPVRPAKEIARLGGSLSTDGVARIIKRKNIGKRPVENLSKRCEFVLEMRQVPDGTLETGLQIFDALIRLQTMRKSDLYMSNEDFIPLAIESSEPKSLMNYYLFTQAAGLPYDNVFNNVYITAIRRDGHYVYYFSPWDMDMGFKQLFRSDRDDLNLWLVLPTRMLDLGVGGVREAAWEIWHEKRAGILSDDAIYEWMMGVEEYVNASGAFLRETEKWRGEPETLNLEGLRYFMTEHMKTIEAFVEDPWRPEGVPEEEI